MFKILITGFMAAAFLTGCATPIPRGEATRSGIEAALFDAAFPPVIPAEVEAALLPEVGVDLPDPAANNERFDVDTDQTPARTFFMALVRGTPYNMVVHPDVSGRISLSMTSVTVPEVLDVVSDVYGYAVRETHTGFTVLPNTVQSRIFQLDYLNLRRSGTSSTRVSFGQASTGGGGGSASGSGQEGSRAPQNQVQRFAGAGIETIYEADFWTELRETLEQIVGDHEDHQVVVNAQSGVIVVRAMPGRLRHVEEYLEIVQSIAQRQVVIEAKIIEVQLSDAFQAGINWAAVAQNSSGDTYTFGQRTPPFGFGGDSDDLGGRPIVIEPGEVTTGFVSATVGGAFAMAFDIGDFNSFIELLELQGETRVLSSPRVSTLNNQKAVIKVGSDEYFVTDVSSDTVTGVSAATSRDITLTPFFSGISLDVTPQISANGEIIMHIHPTVSDVTDQQKVITVSGETDTLPLAFSEIRESDSIVRAKSGQIIVIGGLMKTSMRTEVFGTPVLRHIPGIGRLFQSTREVETKSELVILLKPIVVDNDDVWTTMTGESLQSIRRLAQQ